MNPKASRTLTTGLIALGLALLAPGAHAASSCPDLAQLRLPGTIILHAEEISGAFRAGRGAPMNLPPICRVAGTIDPAIQFEVWLPQPADYNGRLQAVGGGGLAGSISYAAMATAIGAGFASASTDTGHRADDSDWLYDPQRREDYGYRAIHEMTVKAKAIIEAFYGGHPDYSYFNGCSTGGRQGLMEAQRFPDDYDGIVSGAPVNTFTRLHMGQLWTAHATLTQPGAALTSDDFALVGQAVLDQCDANDGVKDGILTDPRTCHFDPKSLVCKGRSSSSCLSEAKVEALGMIYGGAVNLRTGVQIYPGLEPGSEPSVSGNPGWGMLMNGRSPFGLDIPVLGSMGFEKRDWDWRTFDFDEDVGLIDNKLAHVLNAVDPDLRNFKSHGGKLIVYHGWADPGVMPERTIDYYNEIVDFASAATGGDGRSFTDEYLKLYMVPGMGHCSGGSGPDQFDFMSPIVDWVENDQAPDRVIASKRDGSMTRPLCPHPEVATYTRGDTSSAASFRCELPR